MAWFITYHLIYLTGILKHYSTYKNSNHAKLPIFSGAKKNTRKVLVDFPGVFISLQLNSDIGPELFNNKSGV
tara:strand:- start:112 stop:327 length:216 start_codon:yes stop_codon:yes gene_type:complete